MLCLKECREGGQSLYVAPKVRTTIFLPLGWQNAQHLFQTDEVYELENLASV